MAIWYIYSGAAGSADGSSWTDAFTTLGAAFTAGAAGDTFYLANDHAQTQASALTLTSPGTSASPCYVLCVSRTGSVPPVSADLVSAFSATITTTGANDITVNGTSYWYGIDFSAGTGGVVGKVNIVTGWNYFKKCRLKKGSTSNSANAITLGGSSTNTTYSMVFDETVVQFGHASDSINPRGIRLIWKNTPNAINGATLPTTLFINSQNYGGNIICEGVDFSALGSGKTLVGSISAAQTFIFKDCKFGASVTIHTSTMQSPGGAEVYVSRSDSAGTNYVEKKFSYTGSLIDETVIVRTGGATDGTTKKSRNITTTANSQWVTAFECPAIAIWNDVSGSSVSATIEGVWNAASLPDNDEIWFDVEYLGASGDPLGSFATGTKADILATGTALTASTAAWDSLVTARANSTAYSLGDVRKVASNSGRIFFCTTAGTTAGSEPAGYASAVDGDSVTDNTAVFRAGVRFKKTVNFTPQQKGTVYAYVKAALASSTFYIDPLITLS